MTTDRYRKPWACAGEAQEFSVRVLCLGNELLADDSLGGIVAEQIRQFAPADVEVVSTPEAGFHLLDYVLNVRRLVVVDTVMTGTGPPGTIYAFHDHELETVPGGSPHYVGLYETLTLARCLELPVADEVVFLAVEAADCSTLGGEMHPGIRAVVPSIIRMVRELLPSIEKTKHAGMLNF
ncbi:MAG TPA: hydrogenase maturation protease [Terriglobales bacterium]|nr:hydrogenase maturation protease [Terriglobales bacterium]